MRILLLIGILQLGIRTAGAQPASVTELRREADQALASQQYKRAYELYSRVIRGYEELGNLADATEVRLSQGASMTHFMELKRCIQLFRETADLARKNQWTSILARSLHALMDLYGYQNSTDQVLEITAEILALPNQHEAIYSDAYTTRGKIFETSRSPGEAERAYLQAVEIDQNAGDSASLTSSLMDLASFYAGQGRNAEALRYLHEGLALAAQTRRHYLQASYSQLMATLYLREENYRLAERYAQLSFQLNQDLEVPLNAAKARFILARSAAFRGETDVAMENYQQVLGIFQHHNALIQILLCHVAISEIHIQKRNWKKASWYLSFADSLFQKIEDPYAQVDYLDTKGRLLLAQKGSPLIDRFLYRFQILVDSLEDPVVHRKWHKLSAAFHHQKKDFQKAAQHYYQYQQLADSLFLRARLELQAELDTQILQAQTEKNQALLAQGKTEEALKISRRYTRLYLLAMVLTGLGAFGYCRFYLKKQAATPIS